MAATPTKRSHPIEAEIAPPGPKYPLPPLTGVDQHDVRKNMAPAWSLAPKRQYEINKNPGPGYAYRDILTNKGMQSAPAYSVGGKNLAKALNSNPAPGHYNTMKPQGTLHHENTPPAYSMGSIDARVKFKSGVPGPNQYSLKGGVGDLFPNKKNSARYELHGNYLYGGSHYEGLKLKAGHPGPSAYAAMDPSINKRKNPQYSCQGRTVRKDYNSSKMTPAPGTYNPDKPKSGFMGGRSMGVRHSNYMLNMITPMDCY